MESQAIEQLKNIVAQLKQAREAKEIKLEDIAAKTFIPLRLLKAMDEERFERLPEPVFVQGFIRRYAEQVGLDGQALSRQFEVAPPVLTKPAEEFLVPDEDGPTPTPATPAEPRIKDKIAPPPAPEPAPYNPPQTSDWTDGAVADTDQAAGTTPWFYWVGAATGAVLLGVGIASLLGKSNSSQPTPSPSIATSTTPTASSKPVASPKSTAPSIAPSASVAPPETLKPSPAPQASPSPSPSPSAAPSPTGPNTITLNVTDTSWVEVVVDGKPLLAEELPKGTQKTISGKTIEVSSGNAGGISIGTNQAAPQPLGAPGAVVSKTFGQATP